MVRKLARIFGWLLGGVFGLAIVAYVVLLLANLRDRSPAPEIAELKSLQDLAAPVVSEGNSYLYMLGFASPPEADPMALGLERYQWMARERPPFGDENDPLGDDFDYRSLRSEVVAGLAGACSDPVAECIQALSSGGEAIEEWLTVEGWLLDRYRTLIRMRTLREAVPFGVLAPLPSYGVMFDGQRLLMADAWKSAVEANGEAVRIALSEDLRYWRMALAHSDALITKMVAIAAISGHFKRGNLILRRLPPAIRAEGIPLSWREPISDAERSMKRTFAGEWSYFDASMRRMIHDVRDFSSELSVLDRFVSLMMLPFWKHQDNANRLARAMIDLGDAFDVPYAEIPEAIETAKRMSDSARKPFSRLYNLTGDLFAFVSYRTFSDYAARVNDLEGIRRIALLAAEIRADGVLERDVAQRILISDITNPYTNRPFGWDDGKNTIIFQGLEPGSRSKHEVTY